MTRTRRCCCCRNLPCIFPGLFKPSGDAISLTTANPLKFDPSDNAGTGSVAYDWVNKKVYSAQLNDTANSRIHIGRWENDMQTGNLAGTVASGFHILAGSGTYFLAVNPQGQHIFYPAAANGTSKPTLLRRMNYDGTNDQTLLSFSSPLGNAVDVRNVITSRFEEYVFHTRTDTDGATTNVELRRCNSDGSSNTQLFRDVGGSTPLSIAIDNIGKRVFWSDSANGGRGNVQVCGFDGSNRSTIFDSSTIAHPAPTVNYTWRLPGYSHMAQRLYIFAGSNTVTTDMGLYSMKADGTDFKGEFIYPKVIETSFGVDILSHRLACGWDKTGVSTSAS
jgi:hypothetical protein